MSPSLTHTSCRVLLSLLFGYVVIDAVAAECLGEICPKAVSGDILMQQRSQLSQMLSGRLRKGAATGAPATTGCPMFGVVGTSTCGPNCTSPCAAVPEATPGLPRESPFRHSERRVRVVSVHVGTSDWVAMQALMVQRYVDLRFDLYTIVNDGSENQTARTWKKVTGRKPAYVAPYAFVASLESTARSRRQSLLNADASRDHGVQLDHLLEKACPVDAPPEDVLMVLDADAWPVASLTEHVLPLIDADNEIEMVAVRRTVEGVAIWPHPSYTVTTCGAWNRGFHSFSQKATNYIFPSLKRRDEYTERLKESISKASVGRLCHTKQKLDTGSPLWRHYNDTSHNWIALERINKLDLDPLFYAVYGLNGVPIAYHQGAGSRNATASKVHPRYLDKQDGWDEVALKLQGLVLAMLSQLDGVGHLIDLLTRPPNSVFFQEATSRSSGVDNFAVLGKLIVQTCQEARAKLVETELARGDAQICVGRSLGLCQVGMGLQLIHIPKTGGTSIEAWGLEQPTPIRLGRYRELWPQGSCYFGCRQTWQPCSAWHLPPAIFRANGVPAYNKRSNNMCVVRNPFDRAASQVAWLLRDIAKVDPSVCQPSLLNKKVHHMLAEIREPLAKLSENFHKLGADDMLLNKSEKCRESERRNACQNRVVQPAFREDCHWLPQWMYVEDECQHLMHTEQLDNDFRRLMFENAGIETKLPASVNKRNASACSIDASMFDEKSEALIREVYAKDFALFGYGTALNRSS